MDVLDKVLETQFLSIADLLPPSGRFLATADSDSVPLVEPTIAAFSPRIPSGAIADVLKVQSRFLGNLRDRCSAERRKWDRFVAVKVWEEEAALMGPLLPANAIAFIDRHYNSSFAYVPGETTIYAVRLANRLRFRSVALLDRHLVLTTRNPDHVPELLPLAQGRTSADVIVGRVFRVYSDL
jgi:hypothetical protein